MGLRSRIMQASMLSTQSFLRQQTGQQAVQVYNARAATYMDSGASITITGDLRNLTDVRSSAIKIQSFAGSSLRSTAAVGNWGPLRNAHFVCGAQNLISTGSMLDGTTAGVYSTREHAYMVSGLKIGREVAPGQYSVDTTHATIATKIATRAGPNKLYTADLSAIDKGMRTAKKFHAQRPVSYITNTSAAVNAKLVAELEAIRPKPASLWYRDEDEEHQELLSSLFPQSVSNPWTNLPVLPRTMSRAQVEAVMFAPVVVTTPHSKTRTPRPVSAENPAPLYVPDPTLSYTHEAIQHRLLLRHRAMGHPSKRVFKRMLDDSDWKADNELAKYVRKYMPHCTHCMVGKQKKRPRNKEPSSFSKATRYMQRLSVDYSGMMPVPSISGKRAFMLIVDEFTRYTWVYFIKSTSECPKILDEFLRKAKRLNGAAGVEHIQFVRSDGGPDFASAATINVLDKFDITHEIVNAGASNQNGIVERRIGIVAARTRTVLAWSDLPASWWAEAVRYVVQTLNLTPAAVLPDGVSPYQLRNGHTHPVRLLQPFGCLASVYRKPGDRESGKMGKAADVGIFLSYDERSDGGVQGYRVYNWETNLTTNRFDVDFNPDLPGMKYVADLAANSFQMQFLNREIRKYFEVTGRVHRGVVKKVHKGPRDVKLFEILYDDGDREDLTFEELIQHLVTSTSTVAKRIAQQYPRLARQDPRSSPHQFAEGSDVDLQSRSQKPEGSEPIRKSSRIRVQRKPTNVSVMGDLGATAVESTVAHGKPSRRAVMHAKLFPDDDGLPPEIVVDFDTTFARNVPLPKSFKAAMRGPYRRYWADAAKTELQNMRIKGVYELVKLQPGERIRPIRGKWVLKVKKKEDGTIDKFRARYVALGNTQRAGIDYRKTTAPVLNAVSLRCIFAVATELDWPVKQLDVSVAYMNSFLESDVRLFLAPPPGLYVPKGFGCMAKKGLYGLCQSGHRWALLKASTLKALGFKRSGAEPCLWIRDDHRGIVITGVVVDDFVITGSSDRACDIFIEELMKTWDCTCLGDLEWCINLRVRRNRSARTMTIDQSDYVTEIVERFNLQHAAPVSTPADPSIHLSQSMGPVNDDEKRQMESIPYSSAVGCVLYTRLTRIDCLAAIAEVARFMSNPGPKHWNAVKRILRYLHATKNWGLCYKSSHLGASLSLWQLTLYVDSGFAMDPDNRRSRYGYIIFLNANPVAFGTGLTVRTATSTPEAEYVALAHGLKELL